MPTRNLTSWLLSTVLLPGLALLPGASPLTAQTLVDSFDAVAAPTAENGYNLNEELDVRQSGPAAPASYTIISGDPGNLQVNSDIPDAHGAESGLGKLTMASIANTYMAVQLDIVPPGSDVSISVEVTPVANNASLGSDNWANVNLGATGGNGFVNNGLAGMGMLVRDNGEYQIFNNGPLVASGAVEPAGTYLVETSLNAAGDRYSLSINGAPVVVDLAVSTSGTLVQLGGQQGNSSPDTPYNIHTFDDLEITVVEQAIIPCLEATPTSGEAPLEVSFSATCSSARAGIASYEWDFGDGNTDSGEIITHTYALGPENYTVTLTVVDSDSNSDATSAVIRVSDVVETFADDFERPDGPVDNWTPLSGSWNISSGQMTTTTGGATHSVLAGDPPVILPPVVEIRYEYEFLSPRPADPAAVGRHGGIAFCLSQPGDHNLVSNSGYRIDWIDRCGATCDHGVRVLKLVPGAPDPILFNGLQELADPPTSWFLDIKAETIDIYGDGALVYTIEDSDYRGGYFCTWSYNNNSIAIDNVQAEIPEQFCTPCLTSGRDDLVGVGETRAFDASCSDTSSPVTSYAWDFGDGETGSGVSVDHAFAAAGEYTVSLTIETADGQSCSTSKVVRVAEISPGFFDSFTRPDGAPAGWTVISSNWDIQEERLVVDNTGGEAWIYAGSPPRAFGGVDEVSFDVEFLLPRPADPAAVGRHGGVFFFAQDPVGRYGTSGYSIDWIDRCGALCDQGYRMGVFHDGVERSLFRSNGAHTEPGRQWLVQFEGDTIRLIVDGELIAEVEDGSYRSGYSGMWSYVNQQIAFDDITAGEPPAVVACFTSDAGFTFANGREVAFDGSCSSATDTEIASYGWDFGDGESATGATATHTFDTPGMYEVTLTVEGANGDISTNTAQVEVYLLLSRFEDTFTEADGPASNWTPVAGTWAVSGETLVGQDGGVEPTVFAGSPPVRIGGAQRYAFTHRFTGAPSAPVSHHGGLLLFASTTGTRNQVSGYEIDWIQRDSNYRFIVYTGGAAAAPLNFTDPTGVVGNDWVVEVDGALIRLIVDGELKFEVEDSTYREGYFGFWGFSNGQVMEIDDVSIGVPRATACFTAPTGALVGETITLDASCSTASDTEIATYTWDFGDGETGEGESAEHAYSAAGSYDIALTVSGTDGESASSVVETVTVLMPEVTACFTHAAEALAGAELTFDASCSTATDTEIASYTWDFGDGSAAEGDIALHTFVEAGSYEVRLTVVGTDGATSSSVTEVVEVVSPLPSFRRGDVNDDGQVDLTDPISNLQYQFLGTFTPTCLDALDWDDSGAIDNTDPIGNLTYQFLGGPASPAPGPVDCGVDGTPDDDLECAAAHTDC